MELLAESVDLGQLLARLPAPVRERIGRLAAVARRHGLLLYLVGGFVRDLLLGVDDRDLDLVVEGNGLSFARLLAEELGGKVLRAHPAFQTAVVIDSEGFPFDVATARSETYSAPAALPEVKAAGLREDLYRRDFTINTLALRLGPEAAPELIDDFGGLSDLGRKSLRVLHDRSFVDDPTRVLRGVRLEVRLGFRLASETRLLVDEALALGAFDRLSGSRLAAELLLLLDDPEIALPGIDRLAGLGLLVVLHPALTLDDPTRRRLREAREALAWLRREGLAAPPVAAWRLLLLALAGDLGETGLAGLADRLLLVGEDRRLLTGFPARLDAARRLLRRGNLAPHEVEEALAPLAGEELLLLLPEGEAWVRRYLTEFRGMTLTLRGADLMAAGVPAGPRIGKALAATRRARLDGRIAAAEELGYALARVREAG
jgi:tRNA nucleotidyltransferase (CCA-adding enzyme)